MARTTAPSQWLPGFDPELPETSIADTESAWVPPSAAGELAEDDDESTIEPLRPRVSWRVGGRTAEAVAARTLWPPLTRGDLQDLGGAVTKFEANLAAIEVLHRVENEHRPITAAERSALLRYTGWGGLPASFNPEAKDPAWARRAEQLKNLLSMADHESARASVNNSHYTEVHVIEAMWQAVQRFGFEGGRILEPAAGIGHFIGAMPRSIAERSSITAIEIDQLSGRMLHALYAPNDVDVRISPFEKTALPDQWFDLAAYSARWRTPFRCDGGQYSAVMADSIPR